MEKNCKEDRFIVDERNMIFWKKMKDEWDAQLKLKNNHLNGQKCTEQDHRGCRWWGIDSSAEREKKKREMTRPDCRIKRRQNACSRISTERGRCPEKPREYYILYS